MSIYRRDEVFPEWEPIPWGLASDAADEQERGFHQRALKPIAWKKVDWAAFPSEGILGHDRHWFVSNDIVAVAALDGEDFILIQNTWHGFPDPPEWGLWSRPSGGNLTPWQPWGHVPELPAAWSLPEELAR